MLAQGVLFHTQGVAYFELSIICLMANSRKGWQRRVIVIYVRRYAYQTKTFVWWPSTSHRKRKRTWSCGHVWKRKPV